MWAYLPVVYFAAISSVMVGSLGLRWALGVLMLTTTLPQNTTRQSGGVAWGGGDRGLTREGDGVNGEGSAFPRVLSEKKHQSERRQS